MVIWFWTLLSMIVGAVYGSGLNVWLWRSNDEILRGRRRSACTVCHTTLAWYDLVPIASYLILAGSCRKCRSPIPRWYPYLETLCALVGGLTTYTLITHHTPLIGSALTLVFVAGLMALAAYDALYQYIPLIPVGVLALLGGIALPLSSHRDIISLLMPSGGAALFFGLQYLVSRGRWIGSGDIYLGALLGLWLGTTNTIIALYIAYCVGAIIALALLVQKKATTQTHLPLGTFLIFGAYCALLWGEYILKCVNRLFY